MAAEGAMNQRLREELAKLQVEINEEKSRNVELDRGESFGFLGFDFRRLRSIGRQVWRAHYTPKMKKRTALLRKLKEVFRRYQSRPVDRLVELINPVLRGWVTYFAIGNSSECFSFIKDWVEKKIRRHMGRSRNRRGFGWTRWSRQWIYEELKLFNGYRVRACNCPPSTSGTIGPITPGTKQTGKRSAGKPHAAFDVAGAGNVTMVPGLRAIAKAMGLPPGTYRARACSRPYLCGGAHRNMRPYRDLYLPTNGLLLASLICKGSIPSGHKLPTTTSDLP